MGFGEVPWADQELNLDLRGMNPLDYRYHIHPDLWLKLVAKSQKFDNFGFSSTIDGILVNIFVPVIKFSDIYIS